MSRIQANSGKASPPTIGVFSNTSTPNGLDDTNNVITLHKADATNPGGLTSADWTTFNNKVTSLSINSTNGFAGSSSGGSTPTLTISTTVTGLLKGNGTAISAAISGTDYSAGTSGLATGILKSTTGTGVLSIAVAGDFPILNQNTTGTATNITASSNSTLVTLSSLSLPASQLTGLGNLTDVGTDGIIITGGTGAVIGSGTSISQHVADSTHNGYLSSSDWTSFNNKLTSTLPNTDIFVGNASNIAIAVPLSGDATISNTGALTLSTVNGNVGSFGSSTSIPSFTVNAKGLITAASGNVVIAPAGTLTGTTLASNVVFSSLTTLGVMSTSLDMGSNFIHNVLDPVLGQDAATKSYVDAGLAALNPAEAVYAATTVNIPGTYLNGAFGVGATFTTTATGVFTVDGVTPPFNSRILIKDQTSGFQNGIYNLTTLGSIGIPAIFTRSTDYNTSSDMNVAGLIPVQNGTINALSSWQQIAVITTVGTDSLIFMEFTANPSLYLLKANNLSDVSNAVASFNNISPMTTLGDIIYENATPSGTRLPGNITSTKQFLSQTGTGTISAAPVWTALVSGDIPNNAANTTGTASNITASSNSTLTTLSSLSLPTTQLTGTLQAAQFPALTGDVTTTAGSLVTTLATVNGNVGTFGSSSSSITLTVNAKGLITAVSNSSITAPAGALTGTTLAANVVNSSLTSVGTITTGVWNGTTIGVPYGGTGLSTTPTNGQLLIGNSTNYTLSTLTAGRGISITNGSGSITVATSNATTTKTANYTILSTDSIIFCDTSGGAFTLTLPNPSTLAGTIFRIIDTTGNFQTNNLTLAPFGSEKIEGLAASKILQTAWGWFNVTTNGTDWYVGG